MPAIADVSSPETVLAMQRTAGNTAVSRYLAGRAGRPAIARKATVKLDGWGDPLIGDDDSQVTFVPRGSFIPNELEGGLGDPQRAREVLDAINQQRMAGSDMLEAGGYQGTLNIRAGTKGTVELKLKAYFEFDQKVNDEYAQEMSCSWDVAVDAAGKITIGSPRQDVSRPGDKEPEFSLDGLNPDQNPEAGTVDITPKFVSYQVNDVPNVTVGAEVGGQKGGAGVQGTLGNERSYPPGIMVKTFRLRIQPIGIESPQPVVRQIRTHEVLFERPEQDEVSGDQEAALYRFYTSLSSDTRRRLRDGEEQVRLDGYASSTGAGPYNRELAARRVDSVEARLRHFGAKKFNVAAPGEYEEGVGEPKEAVESQDRRKVVIEVVEEPVTPGASADE
jgi:hypothetical protein